MRIEKLADRSFGRQRLFIVGLVKKNKPNLSNIPAEVRFPAPPSRRPGNPNAVKINSRVASSARYGHEEIATNHEFLIEAVKKNKT